MDNHCCCCCCSEQNPELQFVAVAICCWGWSWWWVIRAAHCTAYQASTNWFPHSRWDMLWGKEQAAAASKPKWARIQPLFRGGLTSLDVLLKHQVHPDPDLKSAPCQGNWVAAKLHTGGPRKPRWAEHYKEDIPRQSSLDKRVQVMLSRLWQGRAGCVIPRGVRTWFQDGGDSTHLSMYPKKWFMSVFGQCFCFVSFVRREQGSHQMCRRLVHLFSQKGKRESNTKNLCLVHFGCFCTCF